MSSIKSDSVKPVSFTSPANPLDLLGVLKEIKDAYANTDKFKAELVQSLSEKDFETILLKVLFEESKKKYSTQQKVDALGEAIVALEQKEKLIKFLKGKDHFLTKEVENYSWTKWDDGYSMMLKEVLELIK